MADRKLSQLPALTGANTASGDLLYIVDVSEPLAADQSKKITLTEFQSAPISAGTANGLLYLNASKVPTSGAGLTYDGTDLTVVGAVNAGSVNTTTLDLTNLEVTNIKAKDGTAAATIADATGKITVSTELAVDNLNLSGNTIASTDTDGNIVLAPNGNGDVQLDADTVRIGDANSNALITTNGTGDLVLNTNSGTNSGFITIEDGVNGNIIIAPNGTGQVQITNAALDLTTIEVTNIKAKDGTAAMTLADSTGVTTFAANPILNAGTANGVPYLNGSKVLTTGSALTYNGTALTSTASGAISGIFNRDTSSGATLQIQVVGNNVGTLGSDTGGNGRFDLAAATSMQLRATGSGSFMSFDANNAEQMRLTSTGLGIGTSSPTQPLSIARGSGVAAYLDVAGGGRTLGTNSFTFGQASDGVVAFFQRENAAMFWATNSTERMRLDSSGNLGLGVTPSAWGAGHRALQVAGSTANYFMGANANATLFGVNFFYDGAIGDNKYVATGFASTLVQSNGQFQFLTAPSGTAGNAITFTQAMTLDASGRLAVGATNPASTGLDTGVTQAFFVAPNNNVGAAATFIADSVGRGILVADQAKTTIAAITVSSSVVAVGANSNTPLVFVTNATERARITSGGTFQTSLDASIYGVTVGRGAGAVSTNTAVGASALAANTSGANNVAVGWAALNGNTTASDNAAFGSEALYLNTTGFGNTAVGRFALRNNTTASKNTGVGTGAGGNNTTGSNNTAIGNDSLRLNTTGANNTVLGNDALYSNTTASDNTAVGYQAGYSNTTATDVAALGYRAAYNNTTALGTVAIGAQAGLAVTTGNYNVFVGPFAGQGVGGNITGAGNTAVGPSAGASLTTGSYNSFFGPAGQVNQGPGGLITTGSKNTILGGYNGNQGGLDIRTANNYIVLSDGDGNPRWINDGTDNWGSGVDPSNWVSGFRAIELTNAVALWSQDSTPSAWLTVNAYYDSSWKYKTSAAFSGYNQSGGYHTWYSDGSGTANATFTPTQVLATVQGSSLALQGANPQTGTGITFPATQSASSNANTLDDYEEGTWTPAVRGALTAGTYELATAEGSYVKIGKQVTLTCRIVFAAAITGGGTGYLQITGAPAFNNAAVAYGAVSQSGLDMTTNYTWLTASFILTSGTTTLYLDENGDNVNSSDFPISGVSANDSIRFSITYIASA